MLYLNFIRTPCILIVLCISLSQANWLNYKKFARQHSEGRIQGRQVDTPVDGPPIVSTSLRGSGNVGPATTITTTSSTSAEATTSSTTSADPETTAAPAPAPTSTSTARPITTPKSPTTTKQPTATSVSSPGTSTATVEASTTIELITSVVTVSGSVITSVTSSTQTTVVPSQPTSDSSPTVNGNNENSAGMAPKTRNTIIGVVVGIGGTALLAVLFLATRKIRNRKKNGEYDPGLMDFGSGTPPHEKTSGPGNNRPVNPFQSTLENYHNPARVNASSNF